MKILGRLSREPVAIGGAALLTVDAAFPAMGAAWKAAVTAWVVVVQRAYSSPKAAVSEAKDQGYNDALADISSLQVPPPPLPPRG